MISFSYTPVYQVRITQHTYLTSMFVYCSESYVIFSKNIILALLYNLQSGTNLSVLECSPCEAAGFTRIHLVRVQVNQHRFGPISVLWGTNGGGSGERCFIQSPAFPFPNSFHGRLLGWFCVTNHPVRQVAWTHHKIKDADSEAETITRWTED